MRNLYCILILMVPVLLQGQFMKSGDFIKNGQGLFLKAQIGDLPTAPVEPEPDPLNPPPAWSTYIDDSVFFITFDELGGADSEYSNADIQGDWTIDGNSVESSMYGAGAHAIDDWNLSIVNIPSLDDGTSGLTSTYAMIGTMDSAEYNLTGQVSDVDANDDGGGFRFYPQIGSTWTGEMIMTYNVIFYPGMDFVAGGKLPSLHGGNWNTYSGTPEDSVYGWSASINFTGDYDQAEGGLTWYAIWHDRGLPWPPNSGGNGNWLESDSSTAFQIDVTDTTVYNIAIRVCQNTVGSANGMLEGFVNGKKVGQYEDIKLRMESSYIDEVSMDFFYGGSTKVPFATTGDEKIAVIDVAVFPGYKTGVGKAVRVRYTHGESLPYLPFYDITNQERYDY